MRRVLGLVALVGGVASALPAQQPPVRALAPADAAFAEPLSSVPGVRELSDARVVVVDQRELRLLVIDFRTGTAKALGRQGRGPGEFTLPLEPFAFPGDTTAVLDMDGLGRHVVLVRDVVQRQGLRSAGLGAGEPILTGREDGTDDRGRVYRKIYPTRVVDGRPMQLDSAAIERLDRATGRRDTIAWVSRRAYSPLLPAPDPRAAAAGGPAQQARRSGPIPFASTDQWAVARDGRVAVVSVDPYRVRLYHPDGRRTVGPSIAGPVVKVTEAHRAAWREERQQLVPSLMYGRDRSITASFTRPSAEEPGAWPEALPPFLFDAVSFAPDGMLWVRRTMEAGAPPTYDLIDASGRVRSRVTLPRRTRLVGFGARSVYLVRLDADDLEYLQRHPLPVMP